MENFKRLADENRESVVIEILKLTEGRTGEVGQREEEAEEGK